MPARSGWRRGVIALAFASASLGAPIGPGPGWSGRAVADAEPVALPPASTLEDADVGTRADVDNAMPHPFPPVEKLDRSGRGLTSSDRWPAALAVALAMVLLGVLGLASRRLRPATDPALLQVVGRAALSPKHAVYLLRVGDRVLIVGAGTQGPPALLGEVTDPADRQRLLPVREPLATGGSKRTDPSGSAERIGEQT